jgi:hypothetical protein
MSAVKCFAFGFGFALTFWIYDGYRDRKMHAAVKSASTAGYEGLTAEVTALTIENTALNALNRTIAQECRPQSPIAEERPNKRTLPRPKNLGIGGEEVSTTVSR